MYSPFRLSKVWFIVIGLVLVLFAAGCDPYQAITVNNQASYPIKVDIRSVPLDYAGTPILTYDAPAVLIGAGESKRAVAPISKGRSVGAGRKYVVIAVAETNEVVFSRVFTWDELHDMGWRVEIVMQKQE